jgi:hypothetical protein
LRSKLRVQPLKDYNQRKDSRRKARRQLPSLPIQSHSQVHTDLSSLKISDWSIFCRCGEFLQKSRDIDLPPATYIRCSNCDKLSHLACIDGGVSILSKKKNNWLCSDCFRTVDSSPWHKPRAYKKKQLKYVSFT